MCSNHEGPLGHKGSPDCSLLGSMLNVCLNRAVGDHRRDTEQGLEKLSMYQADQSGGETGKTQRSGLSGGSLWACGDIESQDC